jgi:hypothetical protein
VHPRYDGAGYGARIYRSGSGSNDQFPGSNDIGTKVVIGTKEAPPFLRPQIARGISIELQGHR